jgi:Flp pilus assembly CpaF family ATPase
VAYAIATLLNNLFGKSKEPFWQQAYTDLLKFVILLRRITDGYTTFSEVYRYVLEDGQIDRDIRRLKAELANPPTVLRIRQVDHQAHCTQVPWRHWHVEDDDHVAHPYEADLEAFLAARHVGYVVQKAQGTAWTARKLQLEAVERWYVHGWSKLDARLRSSIVEGVVVFLSLFDDNPAVHRTFCPPRRAYTEDPAPGEPRPLPSLTSLLESGHVLALNFPVGLNPGLARILGVMLKLDFQRAILQRIPQITAHPTRPWRDLLFVCDEYHAFATVGETDPTGDERTFALSRQARLMPIVATQSISSLRSALPGDESWRTLLQCFRTKIILATSDEFTARTAADLCGRRDKLKAHYSISESGSRRAHLAAHGPPDGRQAVAQREQELRAPRRVHLPAARVHAAAERPGHRAALRRRQPPAAPVLLPEAPLPRCAAQLLRPPRAGTDMSSLDRILPFLRPIEDLLVDPDITEVMVNAGGRRVFVERNGMLAAVPDRTLETRNLTVAIKNIARACGDEISDTQPILDARLEDGSRVAAMFPPCSVDGPTLTVRKFTRRYALADLVAVGTLTDAQAASLTSAVQQGKNILISGGTGTGKTTLLNALAAGIPTGDRIVLIEETSEIRIDQPNVVRFEARRAQTPLGQEAPTPPVTISDLVRATLRHRPDRILLGEVRGAEAFDLLQALNTGHLGSLTTIHANSAEQALTRLAHCVLTANVGLPHRSIREAIALAVNLVAHLARRDGRRVVTEIVAVLGYDAPCELFAVEPLAPHP